MDGLELSDHEKQGIIEDYSIKVKELESKILHYQHLINKFKASLSNSPHVHSKTLKATIGNIVSKAENNLDLNHKDNSKKKIPTQNWKQLSLNALQALNAFSTTNDIYDFLIRANPLFIDYDKADVISKISTAMSNLFAKNAINRVKNTIGRGYFWALPAWYAPDLISAYKANLCEKYSVLESTFFLTTPSLTPIILDGGSPQTPTPYLENNEDLSY